MKLNKKLDLFFGPGIDNALGPPLEFKKQIIQMKI